MNKLVDGLLRRFVPDSSEHLSDERLAALICRDLSFVEAWIVRRHLAGCRSCSRRRLSLEGPRAQRMIKLYGEAMRRPEEKDALPEKPRAEFAEWLQFMVRHAALQTQEEKPRPARRRLAAAIPGVAIGLVFGVAIAAIAFSFSWRRDPSISANSLLVHAERWDASSAAAGPGVAHQAIRIKTSRRSLERSLYWDIQGKRRPRHIALASSEEQLKLKLGPAGVEWDRPISAAAYQEWHDRQHVRADNITQTGDHLLTLTTAVPDGIVSQESITVRDTDFHPVQRTVGFRDSDTVEITELDYGVLPWSAVDAGAFEPLEAIAVGAPSLPRPRMSLALPEVSSPEQLGETELTARLILNKLHADEDEQIEVHRSEQGVEVEGLVHTDDRKRELVTQLITVPRLKVSIRSEADLNTSPPTSRESVSIEAATLPDNPSALEIYLRHRDRPIEEINTVERQLFEGALIISKESRFIVDLKVRFVHSTQMPVVSQGTLEELLYSHYERLERALGQERASLAHVKGAPAAVEERSVPAALLLIDAEKNLALVRELTQGNVAHPRSAEEIFADVAGTLDGLSLAAREAYTGLEVNRTTGKNE